MTAANGQRVRWLFWVLGGALVALSLLAAPLAAAAGSQPVRAHHPHPRQQL